MQVETLRKAIAEAYRFIEAAGKVEIEYGKLTGKKCVKDYTKESAACKRASMDLSRTLSALRKERNKKEKTDRRVKCL